MSHASKRSSEATHPAVRLAATPTTVDAGRQHHPPSAPTPDQVRQRAYLKWEAAGRPPGDGVAFWLEAERELRRR